MRDGKGQEGDLQEGLLRRGAESQDQGCGVTTPYFLFAFGLETLRDLHDLERLEDAGLLSRQAIKAYVFAEPIPDGNEAPFEDD
ncbi:hypothetical protein SAMN05216228_104817 [Rhizobium tibeticum]|uniref:Uncharacterized protein n=1 Tax=Rhizobium tibeticum TaxID=501024 RepID=A0A1H8VWB7_9HYPH|nr:hypothetical protein RTCCBAU85039_3424 [Rhizobium tibeticum]SEP19573.1 hypothetical protein SAMN05216228_104817 [Rhizobium tibeticum]